MKIALYHGYELTGSGSNEYTRYLARTLAEDGHEVVLVCSEPDADSHAFVSRAVDHLPGGEVWERFVRDNRLPAAVTLHRLPPTPVQPVFIQDKQRPGNVKTFVELTDDELAEFHRIHCAALGRALEAELPDVLHANHLVYQPVVAAEVCPRVGVPYYIVPHGSAIEYTLHEDSRYRELARVGLEAADGIAWIAREVRQRVYDLYPDLHSMLDDKGHMSGVGTDTSLFTPLARGERDSSLRILRETHKRGGKSAQQRKELELALDGGDLEATTRYRNAYDHRLPDDDLPAQLDAMDLDDDWILFVGAMTYGKGIQSLIAAMPAILRARPRTRLVLVGSGSYREVLEGLVHALASGNEDLFDRIVARGRDLERAAMQGPLEDLLSYAERPANRELLFAAGMDLASRVHMLGRLDHPRLRRLFPCCRLAAFPSVIKEASPLVFFESMANGVLPSGSYHSGLRDGLDDLEPHLPAAIWERMKLPTEPGTRIEGIADNLVSLLTSLENEDLAPRVRKVAEDCYDWRATARNLVEISAATVRHARATADRTS